MTVAVHRRTVKADYGVLHLDGASGAVRGVTGYDEKPESHYTVSMGVYALAPQALEHIPARRFDIPDLVLACWKPGWRSEPTNTTATGSTSAVTTTTSRPSATTKSYSRACFPARSPGRRTLRYWSRRERRGRRTPPSRAQP